MRLPDPLPRLPNSNPVLPFSQCRTYNVRNFLRVVRPSREKEALMGSRVNGKRFQGDNSQVIDIDPYFLL